MIRLATEADGDSVAHIYAPFVNGSAVSFESSAPLRAEMAARIVAVNRTHAWLVAEREGQVCGYAYGGPHRNREAYRWSTEVSIYLAPEARGRGVGRALYSRLFACLLAQGYCTLYSGITLPNAPSVAFHEAMGFDAVGVFPQAGFKLGRWHDVGWWSRVLQTHAGELRPVSELENLDQILAGGAA
ncbi:MAG: N-acetyltransferase [Fimbriimonadaceae bacterium]|nr:N-acetyltransferase [Fimbriimonadaceae bacterium]QYK54775.1 MAG: N-acetyltransferase [Fimbriimonadaceae bacterium]